MKGISRFFAKKEFKMEKTLKILEIIAFVAIIGFSTAACDNGNSDSNNQGNPFVGIWKYTSGAGNVTTLTFNDTTCSFAYTPADPLNPGSSAALDGLIGSYTYSGNTAIITGGFDGTATISGNNLTISGDMGSMTLIKQL